MKSTRHIRWAGVEFQPDLQEPKKPVRLGIVLLSLDSSGENSLLILGRKPLLDPRPPEFHNVSPITLELAASWVESMTKDILEAETDVTDPFIRLNDRWRWNLYLMQPANIGRATEQKDLLALAKQTYEKFVGEQFDISASSHRRRRAAQGSARNAALPSHIPPPWRVEEVTRRSFTPELAATA